MFETITRLCGHVQKFAPHGDQWDEARREKLRSRNCPACGRRKAKEHDDAQGVGKKKVKKGSEVKRLPVGTRVTLDLTADGWAGWLMADGQQVECQTNGAMGILNKLARKWLAAKGANLTGRVAD